MASAAVKRGADGAGKPDARRAPLVPSLEVRAPSIGQWAVDLDERGWAVVPNVLSREQVNEALTGIFDWLKSFSGSLQISSHEWPSSMRELGPFLHGISEHPDAAHLPCVWDVRCNERVMQVFADIWNVDSSELRCSMDRINVTVPLARQFRPWEHLDQGYGRRGFHCVQGYVSLLDCDGDADGGLMVLERSHREHDAFFERFAERRKDAKSDWVKLSDEEKRFYRRDRQCNEHRVRCKAGDLVLWDSRQVHWAAAPLKPSGRLRVVVYVSYMPSSTQSRRDRQVRAEAVKRGCATSHWAGGDGAKRFALKWRIYSASDGSRLRENYPIRGGPVECRGPVMRRLME